MLLQLYLDAQLREDKVLKKIVLEVADFKYISGGHV